MMTCFKNVKHCIPEKTGASVVVGLPFKDPMQPFLSQFLGNNKVPYDDSFQFKWSKRNMNFSRTVWEWSEGEGVTEN
jgi:hypothetical protein